MNKNGQSIEKTRTLRRRRITRRQIAAAARHIAKHFDPEKIILFGSYAYGKPTADSDVDLLVIMPEVMPRWRQVGAIYNSFDPYPFSMDIHVVTPEYLQAQQKLKDSFLRRITSKGQVIYERGSGGMDMARRGRYGYRPTRTTRAEPPELQRGMLSFPSSC